jgi:cytoskeletal protein RodZ
MDEFEQELLQALKRQPAPIGLKGRIMAARSRHEEKKMRRFLLPWGFASALAAVLLLALVLIGVNHGAARREAERQREGEEARRQVLVALRITNHALDRMNAQLSVQNHSQPRRRQSF